MLPFDFFIPSHNLLIEYDGRHHTEEIKTWGGKKRLKETKINDNIKNNFCNFKKFNLLRISYTDFDNIEDILLKIFKL